LIDINASAGRWPIMRRVNDGGAYIQAWQCIGCGRIEAPQPCIGVCRDKKIHVVGKDAHESVRGELAALREQMHHVRSKLMRFAQCTPRRGQFEKSFSALQAQIRQLLDELS
jgi:hypothetical protein